MVFEEFFEHDRAIAATFASHARQYEENTHKIVNKGADNSKRRGRMKNLKILYVLTFSC